jgi:hypothetical protein
MPVLLIAVICLHRVPHICPSDSIPAFAGEFEQFGTAVAVDFGILAGEPEFPRERVREELAGAS